MRNPLVVASSALAKVAEAVAATRAEIETAAATHATREAWLLALTDECRPMFESIGKPVPEKVRVSCGWPTRGAVSRRKRTIGQCFNPSCSKDGTHEVFISPVLSEALDVVATHVHELAHAAVGTQHGHKAPFVRVVRELKLGGKPTATVPTDDFKAMVDPIIAKLGPYPHASLDVSAALKKDRNRQLKTACPECGYIARTTKKWLELVGPPICPACRVQLETAA